MATMPYKCTTVEPEFIAVPKNISVECPVCMGVFTDPCRTNCCKNNLCFSCISRLDKCPLCRSDRTRFTYTHNIDLKNKIQGLHVYCPNRSQGCRWIGNLRSHSNHLKGNCQLSTVTCSVEGCGWSGPRRELTRHDAGSYKLHEGLLKKKIESLTTLEQENKSLSAVIDHLKEENDQLKAKVAELTKRLPTVTCHPNISMFIGHIRRRMDEKETFIGNPFYSSRPGYKIQFEVQFDHEEVKVYCMFVPGLYDNQLLWPFIGSITVRIVDESDDYQTVDDVRTIELHEDVDQKHRQVSSLGYGFTLDTEELMDRIDENLNRAFIKVEQVEYKN